MCIIYVYYASVKHYPTNDPLEGVCLRRKAGGEVDSEKGRTSRQNNANERNQSPISQRLFKEKCKAKTRKDAARTGKKMNIPKVRLGQETCGAEGGLNPRGVGAVVK